MAKRKVVFTKMEKPKTEVIDSLDLVDVGSEVRFRQREDQNWTNGKVMGESKDGSISIYDATGKFRSIMPGGIEVKQKGPRGGVKYVPIVEG